MSETGVTACDHCDHLRGTTHQGIWALMEYQCCRCGRQYEHSYKANGGWFSCHNEKHGPYVPNVTVTF